MIDPQLVSLAVHEFRTPASVVGGYLRMLQRDADPQLSERQRPPGLVQSPRGRLRRCAHDWRPAIPPTMRTQQAPPGLRRATQRSEPDIVSA